MAEENTTFRELKAALLEMLRGYPEYGYYGKVEFYLKKTKEKSLNLLIKHKIVEELSKKEVQKMSITGEEKKYRWYRLAPRGVDLAISMINLDYSEKVLKYSKEVRNLSSKIFWLTIFLIIIGITQLTLIGFQIHILGG